MASDQPTDPTTTCKEDATASSSLKPNHYTLDEFHLWILVPERFTSSQFAFRHKIGQLERLEIRHRGQGQTAKLIHLALQFREPGDVGRDFESVGKFTYSSVDRLLSLVDQFFDGVFEVNILGIIYSSAEKQPEGGTIKE